MRALPFNNLWANWFRSRYFKIGIYNAISNSPSSGTCLWKRMRRFLPLLQQGIQWFIGASCSVNFWHDLWASTFSLASLFPALITATPLWWLISCKEIPGSSTHLERLDQWSPSAIWQHVKIRLVCQHEMNPNNTTICETKRILILYRNGI